MIASERRYHSTPLCDGQIDFLNQWCEYTGLGIYESCIEQTVPRCSQRVSVWLVAAPYAKSLWSPIVLGCRGNSGGY